MPRFAFTMRQTIEKIVWIEAASAREATARVRHFQRIGSGGNFDVADEGDDEVLALTYRRLPAEDE